MSLVYFFLFGAIGALNPFLSLYYKQLGLSGMEISLLMTVTPVLLFASQPVFGPMTDRSGHRGRMLATLLLIVGATGLLVGAGTSFWTLLPLLALWSFFAGAMIPIADSIALGEVVRTGMTYPRLRLWGSVGFLLVTIATGRLYEVTGLRLGFLLYGVIMAVTWFFARRLPAEGVSAQRAVGPALRGLLKNRLLLVFLVLSSITWMTQAAHAVFFSVHLANIGGTSDTVGWAWGIAALVEVPVWWVLGNVTRRTGPLPILAASSLVYALRWALFSVVTSPDVVLGLQVLQGFSFALFMPTAVMLVGELAPPELRTSGQALLMMVNGGVATIIGTLGAGRIVDSAGTAALYRVSAYFALAGGVGFILLLAARRLRARVATTAGGGV